MDPGFPMNRQHRNSVFLSMSVILRPEKIVSAQFFIQQRIEPVSGASRNPMPRNDFF
jgi:hypothetical protein